MSPRRGSVCVSDVNKRMHARQSPKFWKEIVLKNWFESNHYFKYPFLSLTICRSLFYPIVYNFNSTIRMSITLAIPDTILYSSSRLHDFGSYYMHLLCKLALCILFEVSKLQDQISLYSVAYSHYWHVSNSIYWFIYSSLWVKRITNITDTSFRLTFCCYYISLSYDEHIIRIQLTNVFFHYNFCFGFHSSGFEICGL